MKYLIFVFTSLLLAACSSYDAEPTPPPVATGEICGTIAGLTCSNPDDFCFFEEGVCSTISDAQGECREKPQICTQEFIPVCGCDGKTYGNECSANSNGISIAHQGECQN